ncbi:MAG: phage holin, lambda family [Pseudomonadales bacterium]|nr:phage holin, lambda family [Pseudomonadales bacterium]
MLEQVPDSIKGAVLATLITFIRLKLDGHKFIRILAEGLLAGLLAYCCSPVVEYFGLDSNMNLFVGGMIGHLGTNIFREVFLVYMRRRK